MRIVNIAEMRDIEKATFDKPIISEELIIENVGVRCSDYIDEIIIERGCAQVLVAVGKGNNGADGLAIARHLYGLGHSVAVLRFFPDDQVSLENKKQLEMVISFGIEIIDIRNRDDLLNCFNDCMEQLVVDCILGTGFKPPLDDSLCEMIEQINASASTLVSIDIPSGVNGDSGHSAEGAIMADYTFAIELPKMGHFLDQGPRHIGELSVLRVGFPRVKLIGGNKFLLTNEVLEGIQKRDRFDYKNRFGHVLVVGGSQGLSGACALASIAALKVGCGLVTAMSWSDCLGELNSAVLPEIMTASIKDKNDYSVYDTIIVGPGLGKSEAAKKLIYELLECGQKDVVIDADGINNLEKKHFDLIKKREGLTVLTPHMGEFARLLGIEVSQLSKDVENFLLPFAKEHHCAILLKSSVSFLAMPAGEIFINFAPNDGLATAGSGDVLAGIIGGILGQRKAEERGMYLVGRAVMIHSIAGALAKETYGTRFMSASNIIEKIRNVFEYEQTQDLE